MAAYGFHKMNNLLAQLAAHGLAVTSGPRAMISRLEACCRLLMPRRLLNLNLLPAPKLLDQAQKRFLL